MTWSTATTSLKTHGPPMLIPTGDMRIMEVRSLQVSAGPPGRRVTRLPA